MSGTRGYNPPKVGLNNNIKQFNVNPQTGIQWYKKGDYVVPQRIKNQAANVLMEGTLTVEGCIYGTICGPSDIIIKENISFLKDTKESDNILNLTPVTYNYIEDKTKKQHYGLIAQDVEKSFPELISEVYDKLNNKNIKAVNYVELIPIMIDKMQNMQDEINKLKLHVIKQEKSNDAFLRLINKLKEDK
jgi:hypothetical protein